MKYSINLVQKTSRNFFEKVSYFFSNYLRYILVITQLVVIGTLFIRFQIDQNIIDLKESIDQKKEIVKTATPLINEFKSIDSRTKNVEKIITTQTKTPEMLDYITSIFPEKLFLSKLEIENGSLKMSGVALSAKELQSFYNFLKNDNHFATVNFDDFKKNGDSFSFALSLTKFRNN